MQNTMEREELSINNTSERDNPKTKKNNNKNRHTIFIIAMLSISLINFTVFWLYINLDTVISTFKLEEWQRELGGTFYFYKNMFNDVILAKDPRYAGAFGHTFIAVLINLIIFPLALITAYAFYKKVYGERFFRVVFYLPSIIALTTLAMSFRELFLNVALTGPSGEEYRLMGPITSLLKALGYQKDVSLVMPTGEAPGTFAYDNIWYLIVFFAVFTGLGTNVVLMCGAMMRIPTDVTEALRIDGCGFFKEMTKVTVPLIMPTITTWMIMIVTSVFGFSIMPMLVAGLTPSNASSVTKVNTIPLAIYVNIVSAKGDPGIVTKNMQALGVMFSLIMMPLVLLTRFICEKLTPDVSY